MGDYNTALSYLEQSLVIKQQIGDKAGEGIILNNISEIYHTQGDLEIALSYLKPSLIIMEQIGDKTGLCATLFNMGHIHAQNRQLREALDTWVTSYIIANEIGFAPILQALEKLAPQFGLSEGLQDWEVLAQSVKNRDRQAMTERNKLAQFGKVISPSFKRKVAKRKGV